MADTPTDLLQNRDYTVIIARTTNQATVAAPPRFETRWQDAQSAVMALARKCQEFDSDGITIYISSKESSPSLFREYKRITADKLDAVFQENYPPDTLNLLDGLKAALDDYFTRKAAHQTKPNGQIIIVLIDGEPRDRLAVVKLIVNATRQIESGQELGIGFIQVGNDLIARGFLNALDDDLQTAGAVFDVVDSKVLEQVEAHSLTEFLLDTILD